MQFSSDPCGRSPVERRVPTLLVSTAKLVVDATTVGMEIY
jgi:hypothetical protein